MWKSAGRATSLRVLLWHLPYNWEKSTENLSEGKKNLSQSTVYILSKHPHITKPLQTHALQNARTHTHTHTQALQNAHAHTRTYTYTHTHT
jgi:hypothetical protein